MSGYNNSLRYYKTYYEQINWASPIYDRENAAVFKKQNQLLLAAQFPAEETHPLQYPAHLSGFELETTYPGLLIGSGITHGSGLLGELKLGFSLDYTSGLPVIAGSSIKGVLRSAFPLGYVYAAHNEKADLARNYIQYHLNQIQSDYDWNKQIIDELDTFLFGSEFGEYHVPMTGGVVFHDAYPLNANRVKINDQYTQTYLGDDYITPHKNRRRNGIPDTMVNPVPISFLKVLPGVLFRFQFELHDFRKEKYTLLSKAQVEQLFKNLLLELGLGAKTHVGYGQFALPSPDPGSQSSTIGSTTRKMNTPSGGESSFVVGQEVEAYINRVNWAENKLELRVDGNRGTIAPMQVAKNVLSDLAKQRKIKVWIRAVNDEGSIKYLGITPPKSTT